jgi:periplasmic divalent cation tolerance protein
MDDESNDKLIVFTNAPDRDVAMRIARALVDGRLAACVNVVNGCTSVYRWDGAVETADEVPLIIKTRAGRYGEVEAAIRRLHPYELPEILAVPVVHGLSEYLEWVTEETAIPIG